MLQMPVLFALYSVLGRRGKQPGLMLQYLQDHGQVGTFYHIIPNIALTPQAVWNTHNYVMAIPYILLVLLFAVSVWLPVSAYRYFAFSRSGGSPPATLTSYVMDTLSI